MSIIKVEMLEEQSKKLFNVLHGLQVYSLLNTLTLVLYNYLLLISLVSSIQFGHVSQVKMNQNHKKVLNQKSELLTKLILLLSKNCQSGRKFSRKNSPLDVKKGLIGKPKKLSWLNKEN